MTALEKDAVLYAKTGKLEKLRACLDAGISPNFYEPGHRISLLMYAASRGHLPVVEELLRREADPHHACDWPEDSTALDQAKLAKHQAIVELLKKHVQARPPGPTARKGPTRIPCLIRPVYDIDAILDADLTDAGAAFEAVSQLWEAIDELPPGVHHYRPDSVLAAPELVVRDILRFDVSMGNGFAASLGYSGGFQIFFRALQAARVIGHKRALALLEAVRDVMTKHGAREPSRFPDDLYEPCDVDWDDEIPDMRQFDAKVIALTRHLDDEWFDISHNYGMRHTGHVPEDPSLHQGICHYLITSRELLRKRKSVSKA
jgi:hypothetical protein